MKAIDIDGGSGTAEALRPVERPDPVAGPGEIRIRVRAAGGAKQAEEQDHEGRLGPVS